MNIFIGPPLSQNPGSAPEREGMYCMGAKCGVLLTLCGVLFIECLKYLGLLIQNNGLSVYPVWYSTPEGDSPRSSSDQRQRQCCEVSSPQHSGDGVWQRGRPGVQASLPGNVPLPSCVAPPLMCGPSPHVVACR